MGSTINELSNNIGKRWLGQSENMLCLLHTGSSRVGLEGGVGVTQMHQDGGGAPSLFGKFDILTQNSSSRQNNKKLCHTIW